MAETLASRAASARASAATGRGGDPARVVTITLNRGGRVESVEVSEGRRSRLPDGTLEDAVRQAVETNTKSRLQFHLPVRRELGRRPPRAGPELRGRAG
jgi:hypothetical protein